MKTTTNASGRGNTKEASTTKSRMNKSHWIRSRCGVRYEHVWEIVFLVLYFTRFSMDAFGRADFDNINKNRMSPLMRQARVRSPGLVACTFFLFFRFEFSDRR